ncbi:hypothetical protein [Pseudonocardia hydrocarbonoxydans]|uniref:Uncharacterized protein n=1 Tax=Pseudonocardia hydrocarbonoxydans TaxID=76726 RepID=A0A4Y3WQ36_9PSEU|nr:hypothetical protein [Pseudonocardia hydrocarbonoxydans]GEC20935.1 hypothetical protein PHY01_32180 [Pseudonocardia hydrocarbonoxydans]
MTLLRSADVSAADWVVRSPVPEGRLITLGPAGFAASARLRFVPDPTGPGQEEGDVEVPDDHPSDIAQVRRALHVLAPFTATPGDCWFCAWEGYSDLPLPPGPLVELPTRRYGLFRGTLDAVDTWAADLGAPGTAWPPAFVWPHDRAWCVTSDVDPHWAGIGASAAAIEALLHDTGLDVVPVRPGEVPPTYY